MGSNWYYEQDGYITKQHASVAYSIRCKPCEIISARLKIDRLINWLKGGKGGHFYQSDIDTYLKHNKIKSRKLY